MCICIGQKVKQLHAIYACIGLRSGLTTRELDCKQGALNSACWERRVLNGMQFSHNTQPWGTRHAIFCSTVVRLFLDFSTWKLDMKVEHLFTTARAALISAVLRSSGCFHLRIKSAACTWHWHITWWDSESSHWHSSPANTSGNGLALTEISDTPSWLMLLICIKLLASISEQDTPRSAVDEGSEKYYDRLQPWWDDLWKPWNVVG